MAQSNAANAVQNLFRTPELKDKILFTLLCLLVYRIGAAVTAPGINPQAIADYMNQQSNGGGLLGLYNLFTAGSSRGPPRSGRRQAALRGRPDADHASVAEARVHESIP